MMKPFRWSEEKNILLKKTRSISYEDLAGLVPIAHLSEHPNKEKYPNQQVFIFDVWYPIFVPYVEEEDYIFLKNMIPKREYKDLVKSPKKHNF